MTRYEGLPCSHCGEKFDSSSDVVVCPSCGAPYHRSCYRELGSCKFKEKHEEGFNWEIPVEDLPPERVTVCLKCKTPNPKENTFCKNCQCKLDDNVKVVSIVKVDDSDEIHGAYSPEFKGEESFEGISPAEISAYVGNNSFYFLRRFRVLMGTRINISWNWSAFFFKFIYFFYRKMYKIGAVLLLISLMLTVPSLIYSMEFIKSQALEVFGVQIAYNAQLLKNLEIFIPTINILNMIYSFGCGLYANKLFMGKTLNDIRLIRKETKPKTVDSQYLDALRFAGRTDKMSVFIFIGLFIALYLRLVSSLTALIVK